MLKKLQFIPGINSDITDYTLGQGWARCNLIRFRDGFPEQIRGWQKHNETGFTGTSVRHLRVTSDLNGEKHLFMGTDVKFQVDSGGTISDITPVRDTNVLGADPVDTSIGSTSVLITDASGHAAYIGDYVILSGLTATGGVPADELNAEHVIVTTPSATTFTITVTTAATSTATGGGAGGSAAYLYYSGIDEPVPGAGYGAGGYGVYGYGLAADSEIGGGTIRQWSSASFGEDLVFAPRMGPLFYWDATTPSTRATYVSAMGGAADVPSIVNKVIASERDRHILALGAEEFGGSGLEPMTVRWCDQEDVDNWTPGATTTAGEIRLSQGSEIITGVATRQEIIVWTDAALYGIRYIGGTAIFGEQIIASGVDIAGFNAAVSVQDIVYWMGKGGFYRYDGNVTRLPCTLEDLVKDDVDWTKADKIYAGSVREEGEVWWFYCSVDGSNNDSYIVFNYIDQTWYYGSLARTAWFDDPFSKYPIAASTDGYIYDHEFGIDDGSTSPASGVDGWVESAPMEIDEGDDFLFIDKLILDIDWSGSTAVGASVTFQLSRTDYPGSSVDAESEQTVTRSSTGTYDQYTEYKNVRLRGRNFLLRVDGNGAGTHWHLGTPRVNIKRDGKKF